MEHQALLKTLIAYHEAFAERDAVRRMELLSRSMTPNAEIWGPKRVFAGYEAISEKIEGFHRNWPECRLALTTGFNTFLNTAHLGIGWRSARKWEVRHRICGRRAHPTCASFAVGASTFADRLAGVVRA